MYLISRVTVNYCMRDGLILYALHRNDTFRSTLQDLFHPYHLVSDVTILVYNYIRSMPLN